MREKRISCKGCGKRLYSDAYILGKATIEPIDRFGLIRDVEAHFCDLVCAAKYFRDHIIWGDSRTWLDYANTRFPEDKCET